MTSPVCTVPTRATVREAIAIMATNRVTSLPVLDDAGDVVGLVSEVDLLRGRIGHDPRAHLRPAPADAVDPQALVGDVMTDVVICLSKNADVAEVAEVLVDNRIRAVPILDGARLVGVVSRRDVLRTLLRDDTGITAEVQERLDAYAGEPGRWQASVHQGVVSVTGPAADDRERMVLDSLARTVPGVVRVHVTSEPAPSPTHG